MSYSYDAHKPWVFSEEGQKQFLSIRDRVKHLCNASGCVDMQHAISCETGVSWEMMACVDRLVELKEIREINYGHCAGQYRIFVSTYRD